MVKTNLNNNEIVDLLNNDFIKDKTILIKYAGFEDLSEPRKTFSIILEQNKVDSIYSKIADIYQQIRKDVDKKHRFDKSVIPFDYLRMDAFYESETDDLKIIEINKRNVGMHEISEWLDDQTAHALNVENEFSLNEKIVINQKHMHDSNIDDYDSVIYLTAEKVPRWLYFDKIQQIYKRELIDVFDPNELVIKDDKLYFRDKEIKAVIGKFTKFPGTLKRQIRKLVEKGSIYYVQPLHTRFIGDKNYLPRLNSDSIAKSEVFDFSKYEYYSIKKDKLVLKIKDSGASKEIYIGADTDQTEWQVLIHYAAQRPEKWSIQEYLIPPRSLIIPHSDDEKPSMKRTLFGIFVIPNIDDSSQFEMDIVLKAYSGEEEYFKFDPAGFLKEIYYGNVIITGKQD